MKLDCEQNNQNKSLLCLSVAIFNWSVGACLCCCLAVLPVFQVLAVTQLVGGAIFMLLEGKRPSFLRLKRRVISAWPLVSLFVGNQLCYVYAFRSAPPAHVDLINYTWPVMLVIAQLLREKSTPSWRQVFGLALCFLGIVVLFSPELTNAAICRAYVPGYLAALLAAMTWTTYSVLGGGKQKGESSFGEDIIISGLLTAVIHSIFGSWVLPSMRGCVQLLSWGALSYGIAFPMWKRSLEIGHYSVIGGLANMIPVLSVLWLVLAGIVAFTPSLVIATLAVTAGCYFVGQEAWSQQPRSRLSSESFTSIYRAGQRIKVCSQNS